VGVNFQFLQTTHFKSPRSGANQLFTNIKSYFNHVLRWSSELWLCQTEPLTRMCKQIVQKN